MGGVCISYDPSRKPWLVQFDRLDGSGNSGANYKIEDDDLKEWARHALPREMQSSPDVTPGAMCAMFKYDVDARQGFVEVIARPEMRRTVPMAADVRLKREREAREEHARGLERAEAALGGFSSRCDAASDRFMCEAFVRQYVDYVGLMSQATLADVIRSFRHPRSTLAGCGIKFTKEVGKPAMVTGIDERLGAMGLAFLKGAAIISIDGRDATPLSQDETWAALRGPENTTAVLRVRKGDGSIQEVRISRFVFRYGYLPFAHR